MKITEVHNLSNEDYHNSDLYRDYWSSSNLKYYFKSPREAFFQKFVAKKESTQAMDFGSQLHDFLASKHIMGQKFEYNIFEAPINPSTKEPYGKLTKAYQEALNRVKNPISSEDMQTINDIWSMILNSEYAWYFNKNILSQGYPEVSYFVEIGMHWYKYRPDVNTDYAIYDYKTIDKRSFTEHGIRAAIKKYGYDFSVAMYQYFEYLRTGIMKPFIIVWIMKEPPYDIFLTNMSRYCFEPMNNGDYIVNSGAMAFKKIKDQHELCQLTGQWPGLASRYEKFNGVRIPELTPYHENSFEEFEIEGECF